jgi:hypothetical protein
MNFTALISQNTTLKLKKSADELDEFLLLSVLLLEHEIFVCDSIIFCRLDSIFSNISSMSVMLLSVAALNASYSVRESSVLV